MFQKSLNHYLMSFFRDVARIKARKRRMKSNSLVTITDITSIIFDQEDVDPLQEVAEQIMLRNSVQDGDPIQKDLDDLPFYTREELYEFGNGDNGTLLLSIFGRVYDVSTGEKFYGKDGKYHIFAGRDVTRALATGCLQEKCLGPKTSLSMSSREQEHVDHSDFELSEKAIKEAKKWLAFFETHDSYKHVGFLKGGGTIEHLIDELVERETRPQPNLVVE